MPQKFSNADAIAAEIISRLDGDIRLALPLGLGKANSIANALVRAALEDHAVKLSIWTALTLERPAPKSEMEKRFLEPAADRLFGRYPELIYAQLLHKGDLPPNIDVHEFFFLAGKWIGNENAQRNYVSANYTHALGYMIDHKPNVLAQLLAHDGQGRFSLSCNTDISTDLLQWRGGDSSKFLFAGELNASLPFMAGTGECDEDEIDLLLDDPENDFDLFSAVKRPVALEEQAIGLHVSRLFKDGGTIQIGIGSIGDGVAHALKLRHHDNDRFARILDACPFTVASRFNERSRFEQGLYCVSEMLVDGLLQLFEAGIIKREVDGAAIHAGFFVEARSFYERLRKMEPQGRRKIAMMPVSFTNSLLGGEVEKQKARRNARFVNNAMKATLLGDVVSDSNEEGQVVSGVGGQFNFVSQAFSLPDARSVITIASTRAKGGEIRSNIVWEHTHISVPRHYRDIIVTEYGIADLRGKTDEECVRALICIAASRFQDDLAEKAKSAGKLAKDWPIPASVRSNTPEQLTDWLAPHRRDETLPQFPFGTDFTDVEIRLLPALSRLQTDSNSPLRLAALLSNGISGRSDLQPDEAECLSRMQLDRPVGFKERIYALLLAGAILQTRQ